MRKKGEKVIFIIPGFRQSPKSLAYKNLAKMLTIEGFTPIVMDIPWKGNTITSNSTYFISQFNKTKALKKYILGFSYGAMIAFLASTQVKTDGIILCSLSPYFKEDVIKIKSGPRSALMQARYRDFAQLHCEALAKKIKTDQVLMLYGAQEARTLIRRVTETFGEITVPYKKLISIKKTEHDIKDKKYLHQIYLATQSLL